MPNSIPRTIPSPYYELLTQDKGSELVSALTPANINQNLSSHIHRNSALSWAICSQHLNCVEKLLEVPEINIEAVAGTSSALIQALEWYAYAPNPTIQKIVLLILRKNPKLENIQIHELIHLATSNPIRSLIEKNLAYKTASNDDKLTIALSISKLYKTLGEEELENMWLIKANNILLLLARGKIQEALNVFNTFSDDNKLLTLSELLHKTSCFNTRHVFQKHAAAFLDSIDIEQQHLILITYKKVAKDKIEDESFTSGLNHLFGFNDTTINLRKAYSFLKKSSPSTLARNESLEYLCLILLFKQAETHNLRQDLFADIEQLQNTFDISTKTYFEIYVLAKQLILLIDQVNDIDQKASFFVMLLKMLRHTKSKLDLTKAKSLTDIFTDHASFAEMQFRMGEIAYHNDSRSECIDHYQQAYALGHLEGLLHLAESLEETDLSLSLQYCKAQFIHCLSKEDINGIRKAVRHIEQVIARNYLSPSERAIIQGIMKDFPDYQYIVELNQLEEVAKEKDEKVALEKLAELKKSISPAVSLLATDLSNYIPLQNILQADRQLQENHKKLFEQGKWSDLYSLASKDYLPAVVRLMKYYMERPAIQAGSERRQIYLCIKLLMLCTNKEMTVKRFPELNVAAVDELIETAKQHLVFFLRNSKLYGEFANWGLKQYEHLSQLSHYFLNIDSQLLDDSNPHKANIRHGLRETLGSKFVTWSLTKSHIDAQIDVKASEPSQMITLSQVQISLDDLIEKAEIRLMKKMKVVKVKALEPRPIPSAPSEMYISESSKPAVAAVVSLTEIDALTSHAYLNLQFEAIQTHVTESSVEVTKPTNISTPAGLDVLSVPLQSAASSSSIPYNKSSALSENNYGLIFGPCYFDSKRVIVKDRSVDQQTEAEMLNEIMSLPEPSRSAIRLFSEKPAESVVKIIPSAPDRILLNS